MIRFGQTVRILSAIRISAIESDTTRDNTQGKSTEEAQKLR